MSKLDLILGKEGITCPRGAKQEIKDLFIGIIGEDIDVTPLMPMPSIAQRASGQNQEKWELRKKVEEL